MSQAGLLRPAAWTLAGNATWSLAQWALVVFVSRLMGFGAGGDYALALAIVNPVMMLFNLQLRAVQATDAGSRFTFWDYLSLRLWTSLAAAVAIIQAGTFTGGPILVLLAVVAGKLVEALSDVYFGAFQHAGKLDWIAQSQITKAALSLAMVIILGAMGQPLWVALLVSACGMALVFGWFDCAQARVLKLANVGRLLPDWPPDWVAMRTLCETAFPLGVVMMLISLNQSIPRFALEKFAGREALGIFAAVSALAQAVGLALNAIGQTITSPLAKFAHTGQPAEFQSLFTRAFTTGMMIAFAMTLGCVYFGQEALALLFGPAAASQAWYLVLLMAAGGVTSLAGLCGYGLTALGEYRQQLLLFMPLTALNALLSWGFVPSWGLEGAAWVTLGVALAHLVAAGFFLVVKLGEFRAPTPEAAVGGLD